MSDPQKSSGIGIGGILFVLLAAGYFGFEMYAASRNAYRMEPDFIYGQYVEAARAVELCSPEDAQKFSTFANNARYAERRAKTADGVDLEALTMRVSQQRDAVDTLVETKGCKDIEVFKLRKRYQNLARLNLPGA